MIQYQKFNVSFIKKILKSAEAFIVPDFNLNFFFLMLFRKFIKKETIVIIKHSAPSKHNKKYETWGDAHLAEDLAKRLKRKGLCVIIHASNRTKNVETYFADYVIVMLGLLNYTPLKKNKNTAWLISHPDLRTPEELKKYDHICIASEKLTEEYKNKYNLPASFLPQFSEPEKFYPSENCKYQNDILFVGNTRGIYRETVKFAIEAGFNVSVYGDEWRKFIDKKYIKGNVIKNCELRKYYSNAKIVLNDHWQNMREHGFISNRIFDATASGAFVLSDYMPEIEKIYGDSVATYKTKDEFIEKINFYLDHPEERIKLAQKARQITLKEFTSSTQADKLFEIIRTL